MAEIIKKDESILSENEQGILERTLERLEQFFPEHKVFALDALCTQQRENAAKLAKKLGYSSVVDFLLAYGFESIKGPEVYEIRKDCGIKPGEEPDLIKGRIDNAISSLNEYYPDHIIEGSFNREHSSLATKLGGFWQWLGYKSLEEMLTAYGFTYNAKAGRRPSVDPEEIIAELKKRYPEGTTMKAIEIKEANPDLKIKSVMNKAKELFGMTFADYLVEQGIIIAPKKKTAEDIEAEKRASYEASLIECDNLIQNEFLGWRPLPQNAEMLFDEIGKAIPKKRYNNALKELNISEEHHLGNLGVLADKGTDNELRKLIQQFNFDSIINDIGLTVPAKNISHEQVIPIPKRVSEIKHNERHEGKANSERTASASNDQVDWIMTIINSELGHDVSSDDPDVELGLRSLSQPLKEVALLRLRNPDASLTDIGQMLTTPVGKAAIYKRLEKIHDIAIRIQNKEQ